MSSFCIVYLKYDNCYCLFTITSLHTIKLNSYEDPPSVIRKQNCLIVLVFSLVSISCLTSYFVLLWTKTIIQVWNNMRVCLFWGIPLRVNDDGKITFEHGWTRYNTLWLSRERLFRWNYLQHTVKLTRVSDTMLPPSHTANAKIMFFPTLQVFAIDFQSTLWTGQSIEIWVNERERAGKRKEQERPRNMMS